MQLPHNNATGQIGELALFSLLLQLEPQSYEATLDNEVRLVNSKASAVFKRSRPIVVSDPRYIE
jgi:hypothetical protein